jgi:hypothetical protein
VYGGRLATIMIGVMVLSVFLYSRSRERVLRCVRPGVSCESIRGGGIRSGATDGVVRSVEVCGV